MATHTARLVAAQMLQPDTRLLTLELSEPLGFIGGQFVIVDTGQVLPSGKAMKRAYSLLSSEREQTRFQLAVKRLPEGPCSRYMHELELGAELRFSGPWGKLFPAEGATGPALILATDTGISAALGLVQSARFAPLLGDTRFLWLRTSADYFVPEALVRAHIPANHPEVRIEALPPLGHPERIPHVRSILRRLLAERPVAHAFVAGDGLVNYALLDDLVAAGIPATRDSLESFFNMPKKSA